MIKAPLARDAVSPNPTDRGKNGSKRHLLVDGRGVPLSIVVTGARRHDVSQLERLLDAIVIDRPKGRQHLCADKGHSGDPAQQAIKERKYIPHIKQRGQEIHEKKTNPRFKVRRWVVERRKKETGAKTQVSFFVLPEAFYLTKTDLPDSFRISITISTMRRIAIKTPRPSSAPARTLSEA